MPYKAIKVEKPIDLADLKRKPAPRKRTNPRDDELALLVREVAAGPESRVIPWRFEPTKIATARLAANRVIKASDLGGAVFASTRPDHPGVILFSRVPLTGRQKRSK